ncbi:MAG TPA: GNAT family N-acetyltransferase, partial [Terriglobia bacterium]|nr:GNAT family N-acetyltransferase [Terriglobia bacterium]
MLQHALRHNFTAINLIGHQDEYKLNLANEQREHWDITVSAPSDTMPLRSKIYRTQQWLLSSRNKGRHTVVQPIAEAGKQVRYGIRRVIGTTSPLLKPLPDLKTDSMERSVDTNIQVVVVESIPQFHALGQEWKDLVDKVPVRVFQSFDWQWLWWKHFGEGLQLHILTLRRDGLLVGIVPFYREDITVAGIVVYRRLKLLGSGVRHIGTGMMEESGPSDYLDFILAPDHARECIQAALHYLREHPGLYDEIVLDNVPPESSIMQMLVPYLAECGTPARIKESDTCPCLPVPASVDDYLGGLESAVANRLRQAEKTFANKPPYSIETVSNSSLKSAFHDLVILHQKRWNKLGFQGLFSAAPFHQFQHEFILSLSAQGKLWFKAIQFSGVRVATRLGFVFKGRLYDYLSGFDNTAPGANRRPGLALLMCMIRDAEAMKLSFVDLLRGDEPYKLQMTSV